MGYGIKVKVGQLSKTVIRYIDVKIDIFVG